MDPGTRPLKLSGFSFAKCFVSVLGPIQNPLKLSGWPKLLTTSVHTRRLEEMGALVIDDRRYARVLAKFLPRIYLRRRGLKQSELVPIFKSKGYASDVINGRRGISRTLAKQLAAFFNVRWTCSCDAYRQFRLLRLHF
jgi:hypothetical protein